MLSVTLMDDEGKDYVVFPVPANFDHGFISDTGRSFVYRAETDGRLGPYKWDKFPNGSLKGVKFLDREKRRHFHKADVFDHQGTPSLKIQVRKV